ncbi:GNAT family N-acetyltransferase [Nocardioides sp. GXZ039]|uniref:GNAT family N-acetyltransferase n=1 Tax=Nocardioides sp. GXZ039 TaxID=3136018 RepID=UPI0030F45F5E
MDISPVDLSSDLELRASYDLERRATMVGREDYPHYSWPEMSAMWRHDDPAERKVLLAGYDDGRMVAGAVAYLPLADNTHMAWVGVCVDPDEQHRGLGREMLDHIEGVATDAGRTSLLSEAKLPFDEITTHRSRRFAEDAGYTLSNVEIVRHLPLPVAEADLATWEKQAAERHDGYRIKTYLNQVPDELVPSLCVLLGQLVVDAPTGEAEWEEEKITPERFRDNLSSLVAAGRRMYETVAIAPDGTVAAQSTLAVPPDGARTDVSQWGTFVHREHRGHRLGLAVKVANLRAVQSAHPEMTRVVTQNAETNDYMVSINELMGFDPVEASVEFIKRA